MVQPEHPVVTNDRAVTPSPDPPRHRGQPQNNHGMARRGPARDKTKLKRELPGWQILMIGIGGVIGITIFSTAGEIIRTAGPAGLLTSFCFVAIVAICVLECIAEMVVMWPVSNAFVEFVRVFVDRDFAIVVGIAYWYTMSSVFANLITTASDFASFWLVNDTWRYILFYAAVPAGLLAINCFGVKTFGWVEGIGGILKVLLVLAGIIFMMVDAARVGDGNVNAGFQNQPYEASNKFVAFCICIPLFAYGFVGTEMVAATAFEARDRTSLRFPVRWVAYIISAMYLASCVLEIVVVNWQNCNLQDLDGKYPSCPNRPDNTRRSDDVNAYRSDLNENGPGYIAVLILSAWDYGSPAAAWFFNGSIIYFCLSAANTALYVSSRTLFGLTRGINRMRRPPWYLKPLRYFGMTSPGVFVPHFALIFSAIAFFWLPFLRIAKIKTDKSNPSHHIDVFSDTFNAMVTTGSVGGVIVWMSQCIAFLRYYHWFHNLKKLDILPGEFNRWDPQPEIYHWHKYRTFLASLRTIPAWIGLIGCFLIVFVFSSARFWNGTDITFTKVATAYAGPVILLGIFIALKLWKRRSWVKLELTSDALFEVTSYFEVNSGIPLVPLAPVEMVVVRT